MTTWTSCPSNASGWGHHCSELVLDHKLSYYGRVIFKLAGTVHRVGHQTSHLFLFNFYPNVTTLRSGLCYRQSVCLFVCLSSVSLVHPTQAVEPFGNTSSPLCTSDLTPQYKILGRSSQGNPSIRCVKRKRGSKIQRFWTC